MVLVGGTGTLGMRGKPYGIVSIGGRGSIDHPELQCPAAIAATPGAVACWVQTDEIDPVLPVRTVTLAPFCVDAWPFPGFGSHYTRDGLTSAGAAALVRLLRTTPTAGRRLCTFTELQAAVAGLQSDRRFVYGDDAPGDRCGSDSLQVGTIGADPTCSNPETGVHEYGAVLSHWVVADPAFVVQACSTTAGGCRGAGGRRLVAGNLVVLGGTRRVQTRQAPLTPHTWHDHGPSVGGACTSDLVWDDQPAICADPNPDWLQSERPAALRQGEATWQRLATVARTEGTMQAMLRAGLGPAWCTGK